MHGMPKQPEQLNRSSLAKSFKKHGEIPTQWGHNVTLARESQQMTMTELAILSGLDRGEVSRIESGERPPNDVAKCALSFALGLDLDRLFPMPTRKQIAKHTRAAQAVA